MRRVGKKEYIYFTSLENFCMPRYSKSLQSLIHLIKKKIIHRKMKKKKKIMTRDLLRGRKNEVIVLKSSI